MTRDESTRRSGGYRRRLALAAAASVGLHLLLAKGLTVTHLGLAPAPDARAEGKPLTPRRALDFPLAVPRSRSPERPVHERPVDVRIPPPRQRPPLPTPEPRRPERTVAERQAEESAEWVPAGQPSVPRGPAPRDVALDAPAAAPREQAVSSAAAAAAADVRPVAPAAAESAARSPSPAAGPASRPDPAPLASRWRPREVALLEQLTAPRPAPVARVARDREATATAQATPAPSRTAVISAAAPSAVDATAADVPLPATAAAAVAAVAPAPRAPYTASTLSTAQASRASAVVGDASGTPVAPVPAAATAVAGGRAARQDAGTGSAPATSGAAPPGRRQFQAAGADAGVEAIDLPVAAGVAPAVGDPQPAAMGLQSADRPASAVAGGRASPATDEGHDAAIAATAALAVAGGGRRGGGDGDMAGDAPPGNGSTALGRAAPVAVSAGAGDAVPVAVASTPGLDSGAPERQAARPMPAGVGRFRAGASDAAAAAAVARPRHGAAAEGDDEGLSVSVADAAAATGGIEPRRSAAGEDPTGPTSLPPARIVAAALPAEGRVRDVAEAFARRTQGRRGTDGEAAADAARAAALVDRGLDFLKRSQQPDGRWSLERFAGVVPADVPKLRSDTAATGLALLSFLGAGHDHFDGPHRDTVRRGLEFLLAAQKPDGDLYLPADDLSNSCAWLYSHGIATIALCEAVGMTGDPRVRPAAEKACGFIAASQHPTRGGWRYTPQSDADLSVSGWMLVAVRSGALGGVKTDPRTLEGVRGLLEAAASKTDSARYAYNPLKPGQRMSPLSSACMTAVGALMRLHTGAAADDPRVVQAGRTLAALRPEYGTATRKTRDAYLWYYASQVLVHTGGPEWRAWYAGLVDTLEATQETAGPGAGSWDPLGSSPDRWGIYGGRMYVTALHLLALEVPDRHLPTYSATKR